jgi:hypothetical protein
MDASTTSGLKLSCEFDLCALEGKPVDQENYRCSSYNIFATQCYDLAKKLNKTIDLGDWRKKTKCRKLFITRYNNLNKKKSIIYYDHL